VSSSHINEPGGVVIVPARLAALLVLRLRLAEYYAKHRGKDPELDRLLVALGRASLASRGLDVTDLGTDVDHRAEQAAPSPERLSTTQAAARLGVTDRAIRAAITRHRLPAPARPVAA
jgi:hypothetical protein